MIKNRSQLNYSRAYFMKTGFKYLAPLTMASLVACGGGSDGGSDKFSAFLVAPGPTGETCSQYDSSSEEIINAIVGEIDDPGFSYTKGTCDSSKYESTCEGPDTEDDAVTDTFFFTGDDGGRCTSEPTPVSSDSTSTGTLNGPGSQPPMPDGPGSQPPMSDGPGSDDDFLTVAFTELDPFSSCSVFNNGTCVSLAPCSENTEIEFNEGIISEGSDGSFVRIDNGILTVSEDNDYSAKIGRCSGVSGLTRCIDDNFAYYLENDQEEGYTPASACTDLIGGTVSN